MGKGQSKEQKFAEELDRLLAGEKIDTGALTDTELREALDFAGKMKELRAAPSEQFATQLQARLLSRLAEQEAKQSTGQSWWPQWLRQPVWQAGIALLLIVVIGTVVWNTGVFRTAAPTSPSGIVATSGIGKSSYAAGETVKLDVGIRNTTAQPVRLDNYPPILSVMDDGTRQPVYTFTGGKDSRMLAPGETATFTVSWNQQDGKGRPVPAGDYYLELEDVDLQGKTAQLLFTRPVRFEIIATGGTAVPRPLNANGTQTVGGITVTLQATEVSANGFSVYVIVSAPPDYVLRNRLPTKDYATVAAYSLDAAWVRDAGVPAVKYFDNGIGYIWTFTEPLPPNAEQLTFMVNKIGSWAGPWQFEIPLK